jgi:hypothetical protein
MLKLSLLPICLSLMALAPANSVTAADAKNDGATAASTAPAAPTPTADNAPTAEKKICKALPDTTSRIPKRACLTASEWKQVEADLED